ncbi:sigma-70 family RNA polymerase sigma factor [Rhodohalobacter sp. SW132]|uniref:RNA polymerase sigma factor n=1 Tax=Rhodohalobacter sp. SW132 TaxID=2293433 RepID=UPI000E277A13|nr:sigma-70 family RNA polymerase sigma factor [Rhodohalobacter sp. SW132]REL29086.1 sigma-70 family RNA polymerase sigma factor [Rhodohalobacter sp. SW132]
MKELPTETEIIQRIAKGDRELYRHLVDRYSPMIFHLVRSFEKNEEEVKGLVQEIFVKAYSKLNTFGNRAKFSTWIYSIAHNHCRDYTKNIRRKNSRFSELEESFIENRKSVDLQPDETMEQDESSRLLYSAIRKLGPGQSEPLLMRYRDGMSFKAISEQMEISESALKVRVHRARAELKQLLKQGEQL